MITPQSKIPRHIRLIDTRTFKLKEFFHPPPYAILSHTWGDGEVSFRDISSDDKVEGMKGYKKIRLACAQAVNDGFEFVWCDTCCKIAGAHMFWKCCVSLSSKVLTNPAQQNSLKPSIPLVITTTRGKVSNRLTAAGFQMWSYYRNSAICYAYIEDVQGSRGFHMSRWFTRGWTLQELIAPDRLMFYDVNWKTIGS